MFILQRHVCVLFHEVAVCEQAHTHTHSEYEIEHKVMIAVRFDTLGLGG